MPDRLRLPQRKDLKISHLRGNVPNLFFLEQDDQGQFRFRLAGTRPCTIYGRELKDLALTALWHEGDRHAIAELCLNVSSLHIPAVSFHTAISMEGRSVEFEMLLAPLAHEIGRNASLLGSLVVTGEASWLGADPLILNQLHRIEPIAPDQPIEQADDRQIAYATSPRAGLNSQGKPAGKTMSAPRFKLINGGKA